MLLLLPLALVLGTSIPLAWQMVRDDAAHAAGHTGRVLAFNTLGGLLGSLLAGFVLVPAIGVERALYLVIGLHALLASLALSLSATRAPRRVFAALVPVLALLCIIALRPSLQLAWLLDAWHDANATVIHGPESGDPCIDGECDGDAVCIEGYCSDTVRFLREGRNTTVTLLTRDQADAPVPAVLMGMLAPPNLGADYRAKFDPIYPALAKQYGVPLYPFFLQGVAGDRALLLGDGMHPNPKGVAIIVDGIAPLVEKALEKAK